MRRTDWKKLALTFERMVKENKERGFDKETSERMAMREALRTVGWTEAEADQMTYNIFASATKESQ
jgi:hypothetical protein